MRKQDTSAEIGYKSGMKGPLYGQVIDWTSVHYSRLRASLLDAREREREKERERERECYK